MDRDELFEKIEKLENALYSKEVYDKTHAFQKDLTSYLLKEYPEFKNNEKIAKDIVWYAWEEKHSYNYEEVVTTAEEVADLVSNCLRAYNS